MAKQVWLMRHVEQAVLEPGAVKNGDTPLWQLGAPLNEKGRQMAARVRDKYLKRVNFVRTGCSWAVRARQTLEVIMPGATIEELNFLGPEILDEWNTLKDAATFEAACECAPAFLQREGARVWAGIQRYAETNLIAGQCALMISHQPLAERAVAAAIGIWPPPLALKMGDIAVLTFINEGLDIEVLSLPE